MYRSLPRVLPGTPEHDGGEPVARGGDAAGERTAAGAAAAAAADGDGTSGLQGTCAGEGKAREAEASEGELQGEVQHRGEQLE